MLCGAGRGAALRPSLRAGVPAAGVRFPWRRATPCESVRRRGTREEAQGDTQAPRGLSMGAGSGEGAERAHVGSDPSSSSSRSRSRQPPSASGSATATTEGGAEGRGGEEIIPRLQFAMRQPARRRPGEQRP
ncbi:hypothetical protein E2C01_094668 [Portunus trituberculatus]|uniref:Uncharacterized protein n=1 Tax=Portunus trituberculatus TaxID=210409 RepID=A0A5B7K3S7_PORTR|nr:hypothetical protein [Portunus trituberculatus]